jgi:putative acetyltransferase
MELKVLSPKLPEVGRMFEALNQQHLALVSPDACHFTTAEELDHAHCVLLGAFEQTTLCGIGAVKLFPDYGEITRMFVAPEHRQKGIASRILEALLGVVREHGLSVARLETSDRFEQALALYTKRGFQLTEPFGPYVHAIKNTYMELQL